ncbi:unnamed protein product [Boreogadus saida]
MPTLRTGSLSRLGGGKGGLPDPALPLPGIDPHILCAGGEGCPCRIHGCTTATAAELHLSPFGLVQSRIEGLGLGEADMLPQTLRLQSPQEGMERQGLPCSRGEFRVAASGQELDISSVHPQALFLPAALRSQQLLALVAEDPFTEPPLQCSDQGLKVSLVRLVQVEQHPCCRPLQRQSKVDNRLLCTPAVVPLCKPELGQGGRCAPIAQGASFSMGSTVTLKSLSACAGHIPLLKPMWRTVREGRDGSPG